MSIQLHKSKETCSPNISTKGTHFFISGFDTLKEKKSQHISDNILETINKNSLKNQIFPLSAMSFQFP